MNKIRQLVIAMEVLLVVAFLVHFYGWRLEIEEMLRVRHQLREASEPLYSYLGRQLYDLAYAFFYLGEAMVLELLFRIWRSIETRNANLVD